MDQNIKKIQFYRFRISFKKIFISQKLLPNLDNFDFTQTNHCGFILRYFENNIPSCFNRFFELDKIKSRYYSTINHSIKMEILFLGKQSLRLPT